MDEGCVVSQVLNYLFIFIFALGSILTQTDKELYYVGIPIVTKLHVYSQDSTIKAYLSDHGKGHGSAVHAGVIDRDDDWYHFLKEFNIGIPENDLKMYVNQPTEHTWDFSSGDYVVDALVAQGIEPWGHNVFWHSWYPDWFQNGTFSNAKLEVLAHTRIDTLVGHYPEITHWDLANELIDERGQNRPSKWEFSSKYVDQLFAYAHTTFPDRRFWYNDVFGQYGFSGAWKARIYSLADSGNVYGIGFQMHMNAFGDEDFLIDELESLFTELGRRGVRVRISELDAHVGNSCTSDCYPSTDITQADFDKQHAQFTALYQLCVRTWNCTDVSWWGINDSQNWRSSDKWTHLEHATNWWGNSFSTYPRNSTKDSYTYVMWVLSDLRLMYEIPYR